MLAASPALAAGWADFAGAGWRVLLGGLRAWLTLAFLRSLYRVATGYRPRLDADTYRRARLKGKIVVVVGLWLTEPEGRPPYEASDTVVAQHGKLALLLPGSSLGVVIDPEHTEVFHLDWDDWQHPEPRHAAQADHR